MGDFARFSFLSRWGDLAQSQMNVHLSLPQTETEFCQFVHLPLSIPTSEASLLPSGLSCQTQVQKGQDLWNVDQEKLLHRAEHLLAV